MPTKKVQLLEPIFPSNPKPGQFLCIDESGNKAWSYAPVIPSGMIMLWSGDKSNIPSGWVLCDGNNGTPDLSDKFVIGAGGVYNVGDVGGETSHTLTIDEIPSHNHENLYPAVPPSNGGGVEGYGWYSDSYNWGAQKDSLVGGGQAHNNMPPYYALCYIMKT